MVVGFGMDDAKCRPSDYGMGIDFKGRDALALYFNHIPGFAESHAPFLFGFRIFRSFRSPLQRVGFMTRVNDPVYGYTLFRSGFVPAPPRIPFSYMDYGWHPLIGPAILKALYQEGDNLLLGGHFIAWAQGIQGMDVSRLPIHWLVEVGGLGGGMLIHTNENQEEEWIFMMVDDKTQIVDQVNTLIKDLSGIMEAWLKTGAPAPVMRLMLVSGGLDQTPSRQRTDGKILKRKEAFRKGIPIYAEGRPLGVVRVRFGIVLGVKKQNPLHWQIWRDEEGGLKASPKLEFSHLGGASRSPRKHTPVIDKLQKIVAPKTKIPRTNKTSKTENSNVSNNPQTPRLLDG